METFEKAPDQCQLTKINATVSKSDTLLRL